MFNTLAIIRIGKIVRFLSKLGFTPFTWESSLMLIRSSESNWRKLISFCYVTLIMLYMTFLANQLRISLSTSSLKFSQLMWIIILAIGFIVGSVTIVSIHLRKDEISTLFEHFVFLHGKIANIRTSNGINKFSEDKFVIRVTNIFMILAALSISLLTISFALMPTQIFFVYSLLKPYHSKALLILFTLSEFLFKLGYVLISISILTWFIICVSFLQKSLAILSMSVDPLRKKIRIYRYLFIVNYLHNISYLKIFLPFIIGVLGFLNVFGTCGALKYKHYVNLIEYIRLWEFGILTVVIAFKILDMAGHLLQLSTFVCCDSIRSLESLSLQNSKFTSKLVRSLKPFGLQIGVVKAASYGSLIGFLLTTMNLCVSILVSTK